MSTKRVAFYSNLSQLPLLLLRITTSGFYPSGMRAVVVAQAEAHRTTDRQVPSSIPAAAGSRAFFYFSSLSYHSISGAS